jgi:hypothetical protein
LAIQELEFQSGKLAEDKQMVDVVHIQQLKDRKGVPLGTQISSTIKSEQKARIKPSIAVNE